MKKAILKYGLIAGVTLVLLTAIALLIFFNRKVVVPEVTGKKISEATALLEEAKFQIQTSTEFSDTVSKDCVISQDIKGGEKIKYRTLITLVVSKGKEQITVPDVKDRTLEEAEATLKNLGFSVATKEKFSDTITKGNVIAQSVRAEKQVDKGSSITLTISKGPDLVVVPNIQGMTKEEAEQALRAAGLNLITDIQCSNSVKEGCIISQDVGADEQIKRHSVVNAKISVGVANKAGTTPSNANNFGMVTTQGNWVYFAGNDAIYRMRKDKSETQRICNVSAVSLNVVGEWLYFTDSGTTGGIHKIRIDGTGQTQISNVTSYNVYVEGEWVYYTSKYLGGQIYKMKTDGSSVTKITDDNCGDYIVKGQYVYYINASDNLVYKCGTDGKSKTILCPGFGGLYLALVGQKLVVANNYKVLSVNLDGSGFTSSGQHNVQPSFLNGDDGWVYYLEHIFKYSKAESYFGRMKPDGSQKTKIYTYEFLNHANTYLNVADGWIYFQNEHDNDTLYRVNINSAKVERVG